MATVNLNSGKQTRKPKSRCPIIEFDKLKAYFGEPYIIDLENVEGSITIYMPKMGEIVRFGEKDFYSMLNIFITNTTSYRLMLWEAGIDWNEISDFDLFIMLYKGINPNAAKLIFGNLDFSKFQPFKKEDKLILYNADDNIEINEDVYFHMAQYLRSVFNIFPEEKITSDPTMKQWFINADKRNMANHKDDKQSSSILPIISACINHPGFKYNLEQLKEVGVYQFYDSVRRLQIYESTTALMKGMYSGMMDSSKLKPDDYNFMKDA